MTIVVIEVRLVVRHLLTPNGGVGEHRLHEFGCRVAEHDHHPVLIFAPVEVSHLIFVHIERADGDCTLGVVTRCSDKLVVLTDGESTTLDGHHTHRIDIPHPFERLEVGRFLVKIIPTRCVGHFRVQFPLRT